MRSYQKERIRFLDGLCEVEKQHQFRGQFDLWQAWDERQDDAGQHQENGRRNFEARGDGRDRSDHGQKYHQSLNR